MKTNQVLTPNHSGLVLKQDMHSKMIFAKPLETGMMQNGGSIARAISTFLTRKDTKLFITELMSIDEIEREEVITGRGDTRRVHPLLAVKYAAWISKAFEVKVYKFVLEHYPDIRKLDDDNYSLFANEAIPLISESKNRRWLVINTNRHINKKTGKGNGWNEPTAKQHDAKEFALRYVAAKIIKGGRPPRRIKKQLWLNNLIDEAIELRKIMNRGLNS
jgi:hypothetical protein